MPRQACCGFQAQKKRISEQPIGLFFGSNEYLWIPCPAPRPEILVVDESVLDRAAEVVSFDPTRITEDDKWSVFKHLEASMELRRVASLVRRAIAEHPGRELAFLLRATSNVSEAARSCGVERRTAYDHRDADPAFRAAWDEAVEMPSSRERVHSLARDL